MYRDGYDTASCVSDKGGSNLFRLTSEMLLHPLFLYRFSAFVALLSEIYVFSPSTVDRIHCDCQFTSQSRSILPELTIFTSEVAPDAGNLPRVTSELKMHCDKRRHGYEHLKIAAEVNS